MPNETSSAPAELYEPPSSPLSSPRHPYLWAAAPACALCVFSFALAGAPLPQPLMGRDGQALSTRLVDTGAVVPASETLVVAPQPSAGYVLLRGRMQPPVGATLAAPVAGQVAQVAVRPGQAVRAGQEIIALSAAAVSRKAELAPVEKRQSRAEAAQVAAAQRQQAWQQRVREAHDRLESAQERVRVAQERVARAREVVRRLQNGEDVDASELSADAAGTSGTPQQSAAQRGAASREAALRANRRLRAEADEVARQAESRRREAEAADAVVKAKQKAWLAAQSAADEIAVAASTTSRTSTTVADEKDDRAKDDKATNRAAPATTENDRARLRAAQDYANALKMKADAADARATSLHREADRLARRAAALRRQSSQATHRVASNLHNLRVFDNEDAAGPGTSAGAPRAAQKGAAPAARRDESGRKITVAQAARIAQAAIEESRAAIADAERIRREVAGYERPVEDTRELFDKATRRLDAAQERVWDAAAAASPDVRPVTVPNDGVVLWVAEVAREVQAGDSLATIGRVDRMEAVLYDTSEAWKSVRPGSTVMALVQNAAGSATARMNGVVVQPTAASTSTPALRGMPVLARVVSVQGPQHPHAPALVRIAIHNPPRQSEEGASAPAAMQADGLSGRMFAPGTPLICSLPRPGAKEGIAIPSAAIRRDEDGNRYVAVLAPVVDAGEDAGRYRVEWRKVQVGQGDGFQNLILAGLEAGDRIALRPEAMQSFTRTHGAQATLRIVQA